MLWPTHIRIDRAVAQRLDAGFPPWRPGFAYGQHVGLWWTKRHWGRFSPSNSVSPANHSTDFSIIIITRGWHIRPLSGRSVEWTLIPPPTMQIKKKVKITHIRRHQAYCNSDGSSKPSTAWFCCHLMVLFVIVTCISTPRQRVGKHILPKHANAKTGLLLLGNGAVNTLFSNRRRCFPWSPCRGVTKGHSQKTAWTTGQ
jgi:hypothetical protein